MAPPQNEAVIGNDDAYYTEVLKVKVQSLFKIVAFWRFLPRTAGGNTDQTEIGMEHVHHYHNVHSRKLLMFSPIPSLSISFRLPSTTAQCLPFPFLFPFSWPPLFHSSFIHILSPFRPSLPSSPLPSFLFPSLFLKEFGKDIDMLPVLQRLGGAVCFLVIHCNVSIIKRARMMLTVE